MDVITSPDYLSQDWIASALAPLPNINVGEDAQYHDDFLAAKREATKPAAMDHENLQLRCKNILTTLSKDLRVAGYLLMSLTYTDGLIGLIQGLHIYHGLLKSYGQDIYPQRLELRIGAFDWLNATRLLAFISQEQWQDQWTERAYLQQSLQQLNVIIAELLQGQETKIPRVTIFDAWLVASAPVVTQSPSAAVSAHKIETSAATHLTSDQEADRSAQILIQYYFEKQQWLRACAYSRALRWSGLQLMPEQDHITKIQSPREVARSTLQQALQRSDHLLVYKQCEQLFLEPGAHVWFDLQYYSVQAALAMEQPCLAAYIADQMRTLLQRLPALSHYYFSDKLPFASVETQDWFTSLLSTPPSLQEIESEPVETTSWIDRLRGKTKSKHLQEGLRLLQEYPTQNEAEVFQVRYTMAKLCQKHQRYDLAHHILLSLMQKINEYHLMRWEPKLALDVLESMAMVITTWLPKVDASLRTSLLQRKEEVLQKLCELNPIAVATRH